MRKNVLIAFLAFSLILSSSCSTSNDEINNSQDNTSKIASKSVNSFSGEEMFMSIYFAHGDFAKEIPSYDEWVDLYSTLPVNEINQFYTRYDAFVTKIKISDPNYFNNFKEDILSKDNHRISQVVDTGWEKVYDNVNIIMPELVSFIDEIQNDEQIKDLNLSEKEITQAELDEIAQRYALFVQNESNVGISPCTWAAACVLYFALAVHNTAAGTVNIYWKANLWGPKLDNYKDGKAIGFENSQLKYEMLIQEIANVS